MFAVYAKSIDPVLPLSGLALGELPDPVIPDGWTIVHLKAASLNHHDLWSLQGVGLNASRLPMILGCDGAGIDAEGQDVIIHAVVGDATAGRGDETLDPRRSLLSELHPGTFAERIAVPTQNVVPKPASLSWEEAACLPTAWLTAYRMLFVKAELHPGDSVLVQGAGGGVSTAATVLANMAGCRVYVTSRDPVKRERSLGIGATAAFAPGERLPERVDAVIETVGEATWSQSLKSLRPGGSVIVAGATSGALPPADLQRVFFLQLRVFGSTMGTRSELGQLVRFCETRNIHPVIDRTVPLHEAAEAFRYLADGQAFGKIVLSM